MTIVLGRDNTNRLFIGYARENEARAIVFDYSVWASAYGPGVLTLYVQRPGDTTPYPVVLSVDGDLATWLPSATDTAVNGNGMAQLVYTVGEVVVKTHIFYLCISESLGTGTTPPSGYDTWLETLTNLAAQTQEDAETAASAADAAEAAQSAIENMTVSAVTLEPDEPATVEKTEVGGVVNLEFGIPKGKDGSGGEGTPYDLNPEALGTASPGIAEEYSRGDHVHPMPSASDVGALPDSTVIPAKVSQLQNDSGFVNAAQAASAAPVQSVNGQVGAVSLTKANVGLGNVANERQYSANNPPPYPVTSVNSKTGAVELNASDVGAGTYSKPSGGIPKTDLASAVQTSLGLADSALQSAPVTSVNSKTGAVSLSASDVGALPDTTPVVFERGTGTNSVVHINSNDPNTASGNYALSVGEGSSASGNDSVAIGNHATASGASAIALGAKVSGYDGTKATGAGAIAIGASVEASNSYALAAGYRTVSSGVASNAFGDSTVASGNRSFSAGSNTVAKGARSAAFGRNTVASGSNSFVVGKYNVPDETNGTANDNYAVIIGNGTADNARSNALTVDWDGNEVLAGKLTIGAGPTNNMDVATKQYVDSAIPTVPSASSATPQALGTAAAGTSTDFSRADHVHAKPTYTKSDVGLSNVDNVQQYSANNPPPYPVTSVNGSTGAVSLSIPSTAADVGAIAAPSSPATGAFLVWNGSAWVAQTLATWQASSY